MKSFIFATTLTLSILFFYIAGFSTSPNGFRVALFLAFLFLYLSIIFRWDFMQKIIGMGMIILGLSMIIFFPMIDKYQPEEMSKAVAIIGIILTGIGIFLLKS